MTYDCMTPDELALYRSTPVYRRPVKVPCVDCPAWFMREAAEKGCCKKLRPKPVPTGRRPTGRPRLPSVTFVPTGRGRFKYATDEERIAARRQSWRESKRRATAYNDECNGTEASVAILRPGPLHS